MRDRCNCLITHELDQRNTCVKSVGLYTAPPYAVSGTRPAMTL